MKFYFPKVSVGSVDVKKPKITNPFATKKMAVKIPVPTLKKKPKFAFKLRSPITRS